MSTTKPTSRVSIKKWKEFLETEKKFKPETVRKHIGAISFFYDPYLKNYNVMGLLDVSSEDIYNYLGNWYIRKVLTSSKTEVVGILASLKKFYKFAESKGYIDKDQLEDIIDECKNPRKFQRRFESYERIDFDSHEGEFSWETWMMGDEPEENSENSSVNIDTPLQQLKKNEVYSHAVSALRGVISPPRTLEFCKDFKMFLDYCEKHEGLKVSKRHRTFPRKNLLEINENLTHPEELKPSLFQWDAAQIHFFYIIATKLRCIYFDDRYSLRISDRLHEFQKQDINSQVMLSFFILWEFIPWVTLLNPNAGGRPEWSQGQRHVLIQAFADGVPNKPYIYREYIREIILNQLIKSGQATKKDICYFDDHLFSWGVIPDQIIPALDRMGLISISNQDIPNPMATSSYPRIKTVQIPKFGSILFRNLRGQGMGMAEN